MLTRTSLTREYEGRHRVFGWGPEEFLHTNLMVPDAAFAEVAVKQRLWGMLAAAWR